MEARKDTAHLNAATLQFPRIVEPTHNGAADAITETLPRYTGNRHLGKVIALVPARNEGETIAATVESIRRQSHAAEAIYVVANNCTDNGETEHAARAAGARVIVMEHNEHLKAGALNHALDLILPDLSDDDYVMIQDADTELNPGFIRFALAAMGPGIGGVCAQYDTHDPQGLLQWLQANEFTRSRRKLARQHNQATILVGIAALFKVAVIRAVIEARTYGALPGSPTFYNEGSLCEDYRLTLDLKALGYKLVCPRDCRPRTHAMPTLPKLWGQRVRWTRGALDDLRELGYNKVTRRYFWAQYGRLLAMASPFIYIAYLIALELDYGRIVWQLVWLWVNALALTERIITVRKGGWKAVALAALIVPELAYDWFLAASYLTGLYKHLRSKPAQWKET
jgi:biofilm PGA synthesis N-glycosyltransferase PgaC